MPAPPAHEEEPHPELSDLDGGEVSLDDLTIVPCGPDCALPLAADLWTAWRNLPLWRARVDEELQGEFALLLPTLAFMPRTGVGDRGETLSADDDAGHEPIGDSPDDLPDVVVEVLREGLYRSIFALGAAWAATRCERS